MIRHSLFRPPHSVNVFIEKDVKDITKFWLSSFDRYYAMYEHCFASKLDYIIKAEVTPETTQHQLKTGKVMADKSAILALIDSHS